MIQFAALIPTIELVYFGFDVCQQVVRVRVSGYITDHSIYFNTNYNLRIETLGWGWDRIN